MNPVACRLSERMRLPSLRGEEQRKAEIVARACMLFEEFLELELAAGHIDLKFAEAKGPILFHAHCHQKSMGLAPITKEVAGSDSFSLDRRS